MTQVEHTIDTLLDQLNSARQTNDDFVKLGSLCDKYEWMLISKAEYNTLRDRASRTDAFIQEEIKRVTDERHARLQEQLDHLLEVTKWKYEVELTRLRTQHELTLKYLSPPEPRAPPPPETRAVPTTCISTNNPTPQ